jgi:hypothetical protein
MACATPTRLPVRWLTIPALVVGLSCLGTPARAAPGGTGLEVMIGSGQLLSGAALSLATLLTSFGAATAAGPAGVAVGLVAPAVVGATVCWLGGKSPGYDGGCGAPVLGAYLGAVTFLPVGLLAARLSDNGELDMSEIVSGVGAAALAWVFVQPLVSTVFWHVWKQPRVTSTTRLALPRIDRSDPGRTRRQRAPGEQTISLFAAPF